MEVRIPQAYEGVEYVKRKKRRGEYLLQTRTKLKSRKVDGRDWKKDHRRDVKVLGKNRRRKGSGKPGAESNHLATVRTEEKEEENSSKGEGRRAQKVSAKNTLKSTIEERRIERLDVYHNSSGRELARLHTTWQLTDAPKLEMLDQVAMCSKPEGGVLGRTT